MPGHGQLGYSLSIGIKPPVDLAFGKTDKVGTAELIANWIPPTSADEDSCDHKPQKNFVQAFIDMHVC